MIETFDKKLQEHAEAISRIVQQRDAFVQEANQKIAEMNAEIVRREGAIIELRELRAALEENAAVPVTELAKRLPSTGRRKKT